MPAEQFRQPRFPKCMNAILMRKLPIVIHRQVKRNMCVSHVMTQVGGSFQNVRCIVPFKSIHQPVILVLYLPGNGAVLFDGILRLFLNRILPLHRQLHERPLAVMVRIQKMPRRLQRIHIAFFIRVDSMVGNEIDISLVKPCHRFRQSENGNTIYSFMCKESPGASGDNNYS